MSGETITVDFDESGNPTIKVEGVAGKGCKAITADLERALGKVQKTERTRDYAKPEPQSQKRRQQQ